LQWEGNNPAEAEYLSSMLLQQAQDLSKIELEQLANKAI